MSTISTFLLKLIFEKLPVLNLLNGFKTEIGKILEFLSALILLLQQSGLNLPVLDTINGWILFLSGVLIKFVGEAHAANKTMRGVNK